MTFTSQQIEAITQGVLQQLRSRGVVASSGGQSPAVNRIVAENAGGAGMTFRDKVITEDMLAAAGVAGKTVQVVAGAVITPSGHDYIRKHHISVTTGSANVATTTGGLLIVMGQAASASSAAVTAKWSEVSAGCEFDAAAKARKQLPQSVVCCVDEPSTTACLLNRDQSVRAAVITENTDIGRLGSTMNPHVVCLNATGWSFAALLRLMRRLSACDARPSSWKELS